MNELKGKSAIVTGAAQGLGRSYAMLAAAEGASVFITDANEERLNAVRSEIEVAGGTVASLVADVRHPGAIESIVESAYSAFEHVDGLVNNAGVHNFTPALDESEALIRETIDVNLLAPMFLGQAVARSWVERGAKGSIVNIVSGAQMGMKGRSVYSASKGAIASLTYTWAIELIGFGIRVNAVSPIATTEMWLADPSLADKPFQDPDLVAPGVVYLLSDRSSWVNGQVLRLVNGSFTLVHRPRIVEPISYRDELWSSEEIDQALKNAYANDFEPRSN